MTEPIFLLDSNVLLDILTDDPVWGDWSANTLDKASKSGILAINPVIYAEVSIGFSNITMVDQALPSNVFVRLPIPYEAAFLAGKSFVAYKRRGGAKNAVLPDFLIGAHASVEHLTLLTRDCARYRTYFPNIQLIHP